MRTRGREGAPHSRVAAVEIEQLPVRADVLGGLLSGVPVRVVIADDPTPSTRVLAKRLRRPVVAVRFATVLVVAPAAS